MVGTSPDHDVPSGPRPRPVDLAERPSTALRWAALLATLLVYAAPAASAREPAVLDAQALVARLGDQWRWREIVRPESVPSFRAVAHGSQGVIALDDEGLWIYDGRRWSRRAELPRHTGDWAPVLHDLGGTVVATPHALHWVDTDGAAPAEGRGDEPLAAVRPLLDDGPHALGATTRATPDRLVFSDRGRTFSLVMGPSGPELEDFPTPTHPTHGHLEVVVADGGDTYWAADQTRLLRRDGDAWRPVPVAGPVHSTLQLAEARAHDQHPVFLRGLFDKHGTGVRLVDGRATALPAYPHPGWLVDAVVTPAGGLLVGLHGQGLLVLTNDTWTPVPMPASLHGALTDLHLTDDQRLLVVTRSGRLFTADLRRSDWTVHEPSQAGLDNYVNGISPARAGGLWLATNRGVARFHEGAFHDVTRHVDELDMDLVGCTAIAEDDRGHLWVGSGGYFTGAVQYDGERWIRHDEMGPFGIHALVLAPDGALWGTALRALEEDSLAPPGGLIVRRDPDGTWTHFDAMADGTPMPRAYSLHWMDDGTLLAGVMHSLLRFRDGAFERVPGVDVVGRIFTMHHEGDELFLGQGFHEPGILRGTWPDGPFTPMETGKGSQVGAGQFAPGPSGSVYAAGMGLHLIAEGLAQDVMRRSPVRFTSLWPMLPDGEGGLWLGSLGNGLVHHVRHDTTPPFTEVVFSGHEEGLAGDTMLARWRSSDAWGETPTRDLHHRLRVDGGDWTPWKLGRAQRLPNVEPGTHLLEVESMDGAGNVGRSEAYRFRRPAPFWARAESTVLLLLLGLATLAVVILNARRRRESRAAHARQAELNRRLEELTQRLMENQESERRTMAQNLHEDLGQILSVAGMQMHRAGQLASDQACADAVRRATETTTQALSWVRSEASRIRPLPLDELGLEAAVLTAAAEFEERTDMAVGLDVQLDGEPLSDEIANHLFRIVERCMYHAEHCAAAATVAIQLHRHPSSVEVRVTDDGEGFDPLAPDPERRVGLAAIRQRVQALGGRHQVTSSPGHPSTIHVSIPLPVGAPEVEVLEHGDSRGAG